MDNQLTYMTVVSVAAKASRKAKKSKPKKKEYRSSSTQTEPVVLQHLSHLQDTIRTFALPLHALENAPSVSTQKTSRSHPVASINKPGKRFLTSRKSTRPLYIKGNSQADLLHYYETQDGDAVESAEEAIVAEDSETDDSPCSDVIGKAVPELQPNSTGRRSSLLGGYLLGPEKGGRRSVSTWTNFIPVNPPTLSSKYLRRKSLSHCGSWIQTVARERGYVIKNADKRNIMATIMEILGVPKLFMKWVVLK